MTVAICEIEPIAIEGLRRLLESEGLRVVAAGNSLTGVLDAVRELMPALLIVDRAFGTQPVIEWMGAVLQQNPDAAIVVWCSAVSEVDSIRLYQAGARGVLRKTAPLHRLMTCIRAVAAGSTWMPEYAVNDPGRQFRLARSPLTSREGQVMELIERGLKNREIGMQLGIQTGTVKIHVKHIFEKTGIHGRYGLALSGLMEKGILGGAKQEVVAHLGN